MLYHYLHVGCNFSFGGWVVWSHAVVSRCCQSVLVWLYHLDVALSVWELVFEHRPNTIDLNGYLLVVGVGVVLMVLRSGLMGLVLFKLLLVRLELSRLSGVALVVPVWPLHRTHLRWPFRVELRVTQSERSSWLLRTIFV